MRCFIMFVAVIFLFFAASGIQSGNAVRMSLIHVLEHLDASGKSVSSFFPAYSPPPPPATLSSIPANISSISVPKPPETKPTSHKLLVGGAAALASATLFGAVSAFFYYRRKRKHHLPDNKSLQFNTTLRPMYSSNEDQISRRNRMEKTTSNSNSNSTSDFLYLGTVVNSRGATVNEVSHRSKLASPDLYPLPPLDRFSYKENLETSDDEEEEEFYSPKAVSESGLKLENEDAPSSSSSGSTSPRGSISLTISPFSTLKSATVQIFHPAPPPPPPPPTKNDERSRLSPAIPKPPPLLAPSKPFINTAKQALSSSSSVPPPNEATTPRLKLKPLHWDKVKANSDREMVWDQLKSSSFKLNEEMMETLFVVNSSNDVLSRSSLNQEAVRVLDPKKAQNIAILLKALNVTIEEVGEAMEEGDPDMLGSELLECLMKMAPTREEERRLNEYKNNSPYKLGSAENFLKNILSIPFAFKRVDAMLYAANFNSEIEYLKNSFEILQSACDELKNSRMFMKLLEAVLKTGNRMNNGTVRGDAEAFKLDTLLKLVDVKGADGKTTLLHFVVQEIARTEGDRISDEPSSSSSSLGEELRRRKIGLQVVSALSTKLVNVKKAASMDSDVLSGDLSKLPRGIREVSEIVRLIEGRSEKFAATMRRFMAMAEEEVSKIQQVERAVIGRVKEVTEYFHGNVAQEEPRPFRVFMIVRDFLGVLDRVCKEVGLINEPTVVTSGHNVPVPVKPR